MDGLPVKRGIGPKPTLLLLPLLPAAAAAAAVAAALPFPSSVLRLPLRAKASGLGRRGREGRKEEEKGII